MFLLRFQQLILLIFIYISVRTNNAQAKITLFDSVGDQETFNLTDSYYYPEYQQYRYEGIALMWSALGFNATNMECAFPSVNASDPAIRNIAKIASKYQDFTVIASRFASYINCNTEEEGSRAVNNLLQQFSRAGFPPVKLFILYPNRSAYFRLDYDYVRSYRGELPFQFAESITTKRATMEESESFSEKMRHEKYKSFHYTAEIEPDQWNAVFFSNAYLAYKWMYFIMVLVALLYACARIIRLAKFKLLKRNLLLVAFVFVFIYCIFFLIHLGALQKAYIGLFCSDLYILLAGLPFDVILLHWSFIGKNLFSKIMMIPFWLIILTDSIVNILRIVYNMYVVYSDLNIFYTPTYMVLFGEEMHSALTWIAIATFSVLSLWLAFISYKLRKHSDGYRKFIKLACLTLLALLTYIVFPLIISYYPPQEYLLKPNEVFKIDFMHDTAYMIRALIFLSALGTKWPYSPKLTEPKIREPLGGLTTIGEHSTHWQLTRKVTRMLKR
ncbi:hypothetical protein BDF19DRAFT_455625 [Syncephalis fuscata]|nr:hypothetical protein BDF19DRAFT_455625 [Syncephalis fuscata]